MADAEAPRPRLVSVGRDGAPEPPAPDAPREPEPQPGAGARRPAWLLAALLLVAVVGLVAQAVRIQTLQGQNAELSGELFTARTALAAYTARFDEVRQSIGALQAQIAELDLLVSADPLEPAPVSPPEAAPAAGD